MSTMVEQCPQARYSSQGHNWRTVCATGGGLLQQCDWCHRIEWFSGASREPLTERPAGDNVVDSRELRAEVDLAREGR